MLRRGLRLLALDGFVGRLAAAVADRTPLAVTDEQAGRAAVAVVVSDEADPAILFIRRQERAGDPWSGQMAFPGGFRSAPDEAPDQTARRETAEETGLDLSGATLLGRLDDLHPRTPYLPPIVITPCAFLVPDRAPVAPGSEADEVVWIPVRDLFDRANRTTYTLSAPGEERRFEAIRVGSRVIWGLTERILAQVGTLAGIAS